jgi:hypothetical protein
MFQRSLTAAISTSTCFRERHPLASIYALKNFIWQSAEVLFVLAMSYASYPQTSSVAEKTSSIFALSVDTILMLVGSPARS